PVALLAHIDAAAGPFHFNHVGAKIGQHLACPWAGKYPSQVQHPAMRKCLWHVYSNFISIPTVRDVIGAPVKAGAPSFYTGSARTTLARMLRWISLVPLKIFAAAALYSGICRSSTITAGFSKESACA